MHCRLLVKTVVLLDAEGVADLGNGTEPWGLLTVYYLRVNGLNTPNKTVRFYPPQRTRGWAVVVRQRVLPGLHAKKGLMSVWSTELCTGVVSQTGRPN